MPKAIFTPTAREQFLITELFPTASLIESKDGEDQYSVGNCCVTYRYRIQPGDFVSRQVLGCLNAIETRKLECAELERAVHRVEETHGVIGIVGPETEIDEIATALAVRFTGVVISSTQAVVVG